MGNVQKDYAIFDVSLDKMKDICSDAGNDEE